jgi:hypothetical protein
MGLICSLHLPIISIVSTIRNNPADPLNQTPVLRNAVESIKQKGERLSFLRNRSHNVDRVDAQDMTALMRAARNNNNELVRLSVMNGANLDLASADRKNALMHAIDADDLEITRILLLLGAEKNEALIYLRTEISRYESEIAALDAEIAQVNANGDAPRILAEKREDLAILQTMQQLFSQTPVQLLAPLTPAQKLEYKKMFTGREQVKPSLQGSLMLYEHFDDAMALKKYLKVRTPIATGLSSRIPTSIYTHVMSFLRKKSDEKEQRLEQALRKAIICKDEELSQLLVKNGVELDIDEKIAAQFN